MFLEFNVMFLLEFIFRNSFPSIRFEKLINYLINMVILCDGLYPNALMLVMERKEKMILQKKMQLK